MAVVVKGQWPVPDGWVATHNIGDSLEAVRLAGRRPTALRCRHKGWNKQMYPLPIARIEAEQASGSYKYLWAWGSKIAKIGDRAREEGYRLVSQERYADRERAMCALWVKFV